MHTTKVLCAHPLLFSVRVVAVRFNRNRSPELVRLALKGTAPGVKPGATATCSATQQAVIQSAELLLSGAVAICVSAVHL